MKEYLTILAPEIFLLVMISFMLIASACYERFNNRWLHPITVILLALLTGIYFWHAVSLINGALGLPGREISRFGGMLFINPFIQIAKCLLSFLTMLSFLMTGPYLKTRNLQEGGLYSLILFALLGQFVMISSKHLLTLYLGLELTALSTYAMIAMYRRSPLAIEAAMKYFLLGAIASGLILYGFSILYGMSGSLSIPEIGKALEVFFEQTSLLLHVAIIMIFAGVAFKMGVAPFHIWVADVYQGVPNGIVTFISGTSKIVMLMFALQFMFEVAIYLQLFFALFFVFGLASIVMGNLAALAQTSVKRVLANSSIANMGLLFMAMMGAVVVIMMHYTQSIQTYLANGGKTGESFSNILSVIFSSSAKFVQYQLNEIYSIGFIFVFVYALTAIISFGALSLMSSAEGKEIDWDVDIKGIWNKSPKLALGMAIAMFSSAGIPLFAGFYTKFLMIKQILMSVYLLPIAIIIAIFFVVSTFFYLRIVKQMFFDEVSQENVSGANEQFPIGGQKFAEGVFVLSSFLLILIGVFPGFLHSFVASLIALK